MEERGRLRSEAVAVGLESDEHGESELQLILNHVPLVDLLQLIINRVKRMDSTLARHAKDFIRLLRICRVPFPW